MTDITIGKQFKALPFLSKLIREHLSDDDGEYFVKNCSLLYADDTIILAESPKELQDALHAVHKYCEDWSLKVNTTKTKVMIFSKGRVKKVPIFSYGHDTLEVANEYVYLGTLFSSNSSMRPAVLRQIDQARRAMFKLQSMTQALGLSVEMQCDLYEKLVVPVLLYGTEVWGLRNTELIEKFERKFLKMVLKINKYTANCMAYGELGKHRARVTIQTRLLNFWTRLEGGNRQKLSSLLYRLMTKLSNENICHFDWINDVKHTLDSAGFSYLWDSTQKGEEIIVKAVSERLKDIDAQQWHSEVSENSLCSNYKLIKDKHETEMYISKLSGKTRTALTRFRCGNHNIPVSITRRNHSSESCPSCPLCTKHHPGDEYHYILECPFFEEERNKFIPKYYRTHINTLKFRQLFNTNNMRLLHRLGKFADLIMNHFKHSLV